MYESKKKSEGKFLETINLFADTLSLNKSPGSFPLISAPRHGSTCKRIFMLFRWLSRSDNVDPGGWTIFAPSALICPVDTHIFHFAQSLGLHIPNSPCLKTSLSVTSLFRSIAPADPLKFDFSLSRLGIRSLSLASYIITTLPFLQY